MLRDANRERGEGRGEGESMRDLSSKQEKEAQVGWVKRQTQIGVAV